MPFRFSSTDSHQEASEKKKRIIKNELKAESSVITKETQKSNTSSLRKVFEENEEESSVKRKEAEKTKKKESGRIIVIMQEDKKVAHLQGLGPGAGSWKEGSSPPPTSLPSSRTGQAASPPSSSGSQCMVPGSSTMEGLSRGFKGACSKSYSMGDNIGTLCGEGKGPFAASVYTIFVPRKVGGRRQQTVALETDQTNNKA